MTAVEVCPLCDIAGCRHIRERATPTAQLSAELQVPEVAALVEAAESMKKEAVRVCVQLPRHSHAKHDLQLAIDLYELAYDAALAALKGPQT